MCLSGSVRYRYYPVCMDPITRLDQVRVSLDVEDNSTGYATISAALSPPDIRAYLDGTSTYIFQTNTGVEVEYPFYTNNTFGYAYHTDPFPADDPMMNPIASRKAYLNMITTAATNINTKFVSDISFGEDFNLYRFIAAPPYLG